MIITYKKIIVAVIRYCRAYGGIIAFITVIIARSLDKANKGFFYSFLFFDLVVAASTWRYVRKVIKKQKIKNKELAAQEKEMQKMKAQKEDEYRRMMLCPECGGSGAGAEGQICKKCGGSGIRKTEICTTCEGKGVNMAGHICPNCKGHGKFFI